MNSTAQLSSVIDVNGPEGVILHEVVGGDSPLLPEALALFAEVFPEYIRYAPYVRACAAGRHPQHPARLDHVWLAEKDGHFAGMYVFCYLHTRGFGFAAFLAVRDGYRKLGLGAWFMKRVHQQLREDAALFGHPPPPGYLGEIDKVELGEDEDERRLRRQRLNFLLRYGGGMMVDVDYHEPVYVGGVDYVDPQQLVGIEEVPMHLLFFTPEPRPPLTAEETRALVDGIYLDYYRVGEDSWMYQRALDSLRERQHG